MKDQPVRTTSLLTDELLHPSGDYFNVDALIKAAKVNPIARARLEFISAALGIPLKDEDIRRELQKTHSDIKNYLNFCFINYYNSLLLQFGPQVFTDPILQEEFNSRLIEEAHLTAEKDMQSLRALMMQHEKYQHNVDKITKYFNDNLDSGLFRLNYLKRYPEVIKWIEILEANKTQAFYNIKVQKVETYIQRINDIADYIFINDQLTPEEKVQRFQIRQRLIQSGYSQEALDNLDLYSSNKTAVERAELKNDLYEFAQNAKEKLQSLRQQGGGVNEIDSLSENMKSEALQLLPQSTDLFDDLEVKYAQKAQEITEIYDQQLAELYNLKSDYEKEIKNFYKDVKELLHLVLLKHELEEDPLLTKIFSEAKNIYETENFDNKNLLKMLDEAISKSLTTNKELANDLIKIQKLVSVMDPIAEKAMEANHNKLQQSALKLPIAAQNPQFDKISFSGTREYLESYVERLYDKADDCKDGLSQADAPIIDGIKSEIANVKIGEEGGSISYESRNKILSDVERLHQKYPEDKGILSFREALFKSPLMELTHSPDSNLSATSNFKM